MILITELLKTKELHPGMMLTLIWRLVLADVAKFTRPIGDQ